GGADPRSRPLLDRRDRRRDDGGLSADDRRTPDAAQARRAAGALPSAARRRRAAPGLRSRGRRPAHQAHGSLGMLSVLMATHNGADTIERTLAAMSVMEPPAGGWTLIVVNNASTDDTE